MPGTIGRSAVLDQWGVDYPPDVTGSPWVYPGFAAVSASGTTLIIDKQQQDNRLVELDRDGRVVWERTVPPRLTWAHRVDPGLALTLEPDGLWAHRRDGSSNLRVPLQSTSHLNAASFRYGTVAVAADDAIFVVELGTGAVRRIPSGSDFVEAYDIELLDDDRMLIVDAYGSCAVELDRNGRRIRTFGTWREQRPNRENLLVPASACRRSDGSTVVTDWRGGRLIAYGPDGTLLGPLPDAPRTHLFAPSCVREDPEGNLVVADAGNRRVLVRTASGQVVREHGPADLPVTTFRFPRTAERIIGGNILVTDCYADRVVELDPARRTVWECGPSGPGGDPGLAMPRAASRGYGSTAIADGLNRRVVVAGQDGALVREMTHVRRHGSTVQLGDPHHAEPLDGGYLLLVDADLDLVMVVDDDDTVVHEWGAGSIRLRDPHMANMTSQGSVLIADSGNSRVLHLDRSGFARVMLSQYSDDGVFRPLNTPRCARLMPDGNILVVDTNGCQILCVDATGDLRWRLGPRLDVNAAPAVMPELRTPKWASLDGLGRLLVADYFNSRVVALSIPTTNEHRSRPTR